MSVNAAGHFLVLQENGLEILGVWACMGPQCIEVLTSTVGMLEIIADSQRGGPHGEQALKIYTNRIPHPYYAARSQHTYEENVLNFHLVALESVLGKLYH